MTALNLLLNALDALLILGVSSPILLLSRGIRVPALRNLSLLLASFLFLHGIYHLFEVSESITGIEVMGIAGDLVIEPGSYLLLLGFAVYFARRS